MIERASAILDDRKGKTRKVFTSAGPKDVYVKLLSDCDKSFSVLMTPLMKFGSSDYLIEVTFENGSVTGFRNLFGQMPSWANETTDWSQVESLYGANLIAYPGMSF